MSSKNNKPITVGYFANWTHYRSDFLPSPLTISSLDYINYAFANVDNLDIIPSDPWIDLEKSFGDCKGFYEYFNSVNGPIKKTNPNLKSIISVGGYTQSKHFSDYLANKISRNTFVSNIVSFVAKYKFDGVDIDWEFPVEGGEPNNSRRNEDRLNFTIFLNELRTELSKVNPSLVLTIAIGASPSNLRNIQLKEICKIVDFINIMCYDFSGPWSALCHHNSNLYNDELCNSQLSIQKCLDECKVVGNCLDKFVIGVGFYGRGFKDVDCNIYNNGVRVGVGKKFGCLPEGKYEKGVLLYHEIRNLLQNNICIDVSQINNMQLQQNTWIRCFNDKLKSVHIWNEHSKTFVSFDDPQTIAWKMHFIKDNNLKGVMIWEISGDYNNELIQAINSYK